jgi:glycosyltransferase involved in cell wall biosynthesis
MLSVIIATFNSERLLVPTLAALVPGATGGLIREVLVADGGSSDDTTAVADVAGCNFLVAKGPLGRRLKEAATTARAPWLVFLRPGTVPDTPWTAEVGGFVEEPSSAERAAVFRRAAPAQAGLREAFALIAAALGAAPRPEQGLIIAKEFYRQLGGHSEAGADPEVDLIRRVGRRRIVTLSTGVFRAG